MSPKCEQMADFDAASGADEMEREARALDLSDATQARPEGVEQSTELTADGDLIDSATGEVLENAPGWDPVTKRILNNEGLDWAGARLREKREALAEIRRMEANELERLNKQILALAERTERAEAPIQRAAEGLEALITAYAKDHRAEVLKGRRTKSALFPSGLRVAYRAVGGEYRWRQDMTPREREEVLLRWAKEIEEWSDEILTRSDPKPDLEAIKRFALADQSGKSEAPPGLEWVEPGESIVVKVEEEK